MRKLFMEVGFGWAVRILAFVMLSSLVICYAVMQLDLPQRKPGPLFKIVFLKDASYFAFTLGMTTDLSLIPPLFFVFFFFSIALTNTYCLCTC